MSTTWWAWTCSVLTVRGSQHKQIILDWYQMWVAEVYRWLLADPPCRWSFRAIYLSWDQRWRHDSRRWQPARGWVGGAHVQANARSCWGHLHRRWGLCCRYSLRGRLTVWVSWSCELSRLDCALLAWLQYVWLTDDMSDLQYILISIPIKWPGRVGIPTCLRATSADHHWCPCTPALYTGMEGPCTLNTICHL